MSDVVWVALISSLSAIFVALMTQYLTARATDRQRTHQAQQEQLHWQRNENIALRNQQLEAIGQLWLNALKTRERVLDLFDRRAHLAGSLFSYGQSASRAAAEVYAIALVSVPSLRDAAKSFHDAAYWVETTIRSAGSSESLEAVAKMAKTWNEAQNNLEVAVRSEADRLMAAAKREGL